MGDDSADSGIIAFEEPDRSVQPPSQPSAPSAPPRQGKPCPNCGYDITGLTQRKCPECGSVLELALLAKTRKDRARQQYRAALIAPAIMMVIGLVGAVVALGLLYSWSAAPYYLAAFGLQVGNAVVVFFLCSVVWIGLDDPIPVVALKIGGIYALLNFAEILLFQIPLLGSFFAMIFVSFAYLLLLMKQLDLEMIEAVVVAVLTFLSKVLIVSFLVSLFI